jgi:hypothetical protein
MEKMLRPISPQTILAAVFLLSISLFAVVTLFPSPFYHTLDPASYLVFHNCAELFGTIVCLSIFGVGWYAFDQSGNRHALFLSTIVNAGPKPRRSVGRSKVAAPLTSLS